MEYRSFFSSSWLMRTSCPEASWDFLLMDSSSASTRFFSLARSSALFSPERTFPSRTADGSGVCEAAAEGHVTVRCAPTCQLSLEAFHLRRQGRELLLPFLQLLHSFCRRTNR